MLRFGPEEDSRVREYKRTRRRQEEDWYRINNYRYQSTDVSLKVFEWFSLNRRTNVEALKSDWGHSSKCFVSFTSFSDTQRYWIVAQKLWVCDEVRRAIQPGEFSLWTWGRRGRDDRFSRRGSNVTPTWSWYIDWRCSFVNRCIDRAVVSLATGII